MKFTFYLFVVFVLFFNIQVFAQRDFSLYTLGRTPQSLSTNPSFRPAYNNYISLPIISGIGLDVINTGFSLSDLLVPKGNGDSLIFNTDDAFFDQMNGGNRLSVNTNLNVFGLGFKLGKSFVFFDVKNKLNAEFTYSSDFIKFLLQGNGGSLLGKTADFTSIGLNAMNYVEYGLGFNRDFSDKLRIGAKFKLLSGVANISTQENNLTMTTDASNFGLSISGGAKIATSNIAALGDSSGFDPVKFSQNAYNFNNLGLAFDLGASYEINEKLSVNASVIDLGFVKWNEGIKNYNLSQFKLEFKGLDAETFFKDSSKVYNSFEDSLKNIFKTSNDVSAYTTSLSTRFYFGANYKLFSFLNFGALFYNEINHGNYRPGFVVSTTLSSKRLFSTTVNYSYFSGASNFGFGLNFKGFYIATDNLLALPMFNPYGSRIASVTIGANIVFGTGKEKKVEKEKKIENKEENNK